MPTGMIMTTDRDWDSTGMAATLTTQMKPLGRCSLALQPILLRRCLRSQTRLPTRKNQHYRQSQCSDCRRPHLRLASFSDTVSLSTLKSDGHHRFCHHHTLPSSPHECQHKPEGDPSSTCNTRTTWCATVSTTRLCHDLDLASSPTWKP